MERKIIVNCGEKEKRIALLEDEQLVEIYIERFLEQQKIGNIYKGVVENVLPGMNAAFVNIGEEKNAFLFVDDIPQPKAEEEKRLTIQQLLRVKEEIIVQVVKESFGSKGARLSGNITLPGRYLVFMPGYNYVGVSKKIESPEERERLKKETEEIRPSNAGIIVRTAAEGADKESLKNDLEFLQQLWEKVIFSSEKKTAPMLLHSDMSLIYRIIRDLFNNTVGQFIIDNEGEYKNVLEILDYLSPHLKNRVFHYKSKEPVFERFDIENEIEKSLNRMVWLDCGGYLVFDETEALTVIDVNTGRYTGKVNLEETIFKTNIEAAEEIARQIRLRDIGGIIIIDFIDMNEPKHRQQVLDKLKKEMSKDRTRNHVLGITSLGLVEVARKKVRYGLAAVMQQTCSYCEGKGKVLSPETVSSMVERELKKRLQYNNIEAVLVEMNSEVAALLIGSGGGYLKKLEAETGRHIFIRGSDRMHVEKYKILMTGELSEVERYALPVKKGDICKVQVESPHSFSPGHGIARLHGYIIDIEGAENLVGEEVHVIIKETERTFARAELWKNMEKVNQEN